MSLKLFQIGVLLGNRSNPFWTDIMKWYQLMGPGMNMDIQHFWASPENNRDAQLDMMKKIISMSFDVIIINPISRNNLVPGIIEAAHKRIPVIDVGAKTDPEMVKDAVPLYTPVRTVDFFQQGYLAGSYIRERLKPSGGGKVAIIEGRPDSAQSIGRSAGAAQAFAEAESIILAARENADFNADTAGRAASGMLRNDPGIKAIFCTNDVMAVGASGTVKKAGTDSGLIIVGVDLTSSGREAIRNRMIDASIAFSSKSVAEVILNIVEKIRNREKITVNHKYTVSSYIVDIENLDSFTE